MLLSMGTLRPVAFAGLGTILSSSVLTLNLVLERAESLEAFLLER